MSPTSSAAPRLVYVVTVPGSAQSFLRGRLSYMASRGFEVSLVSSPSPVLHAVGADEGIPVHGIPMQRAIAPLADVVSLVRLVRYLRRVRPDIVHYGTPKAGLLTGIAAVLCRVPMRIYSLHGLRLEGVQGGLRAILTMTERIACGSAHHVVCESPSLLDRAVAMRLADAGRFRVLGSGTCNGLDGTRFGGTRVESEALRARLGIPADARVIGYVGRFTRDKGLRELVTAYLHLRSADSRLRLLLIGGHDETDPLDDDVCSIMENRDLGIVRTGWVDDPAPYYPCMDVFVLPTYREGFGQVVLEASASAVPVVTTDATGARDAVLDGVTGVRVPARDWRALADGMDRILADDVQGRRLGEHGRRWVAEEFMPEKIWLDLLSLYLGSNSAETGNARLGEHESSSET